MQTLTEKIKLPKFTNTDFCNVSVSETEVLLAKFHVIIIIKHVSGTSEITTNYTVCTLLFENISCKNQAVETWVRKMGAFIISVESVMS